MANILILGGGFAGLIAAEQLAAAFETGKHQITLVSRRPDFVFYPALVQVALGRYEPEDISFDLAAKLAGLGVRFVQGDVIEINSQSSEVRVAGSDFDGQIHYDYLIMSLGRRLATERIPGFFEHADHLLGAQAALKSRQAITDFRAGRIVLGMCPGARLPVPMCEAAFALAGRFSDEINDRKVSITIVFPELVEQAFGGAEIGVKLDWALGKHDIELVTDFPIEEIDAKQICGRGEQTIDYDLLMLIPPFRGQAIIGRMNQNIGDSEDYVRVNELMQVSGLPRTYAAGDMVALPGPKFAHMAVRQARVAAENVIAEIIGEVPRAKYKHEIATIIDAGDADTIHLQYGIWNDELYALQTGAVWSWAKTLYDKFWRMSHS